MPAGYVGRPMNIELLARLFDEFGPRVLFKPEAVPIGPRLSELLRATGGQARVFEGSGGIALVDSFRRGIVGTMPGADLIDADRRHLAGIGATTTRRGPSESGCRWRLWCRWRRAWTRSWRSKNTCSCKQGMFTNTHVRGPVGYLLDDATRREVDRLFDLITEAIAATD